MEKENIYNFDYKKELYSFVSYYSTNSINNTQVSLPFEEFIYFNKKENFITESEIKKILEKINNNTEYVFSTEQNIKDKIYFEFLYDSRRNLKVKIYDFTGNITWKKWKTIKFGKNGVFFSCEKNSEILEYLSSKNEYLKVDDNIEIPIFKSLKEFILFELIIKEKLDNQTLYKKQIRHFTKDNIDAFTNYIYKVLFGEKNDISNIINFTYNKFGYLNYSSNFSKILDVIEYRINNQNYRVYLVYMANKYDDYLYLMFSNEKSDDYFYIDKGNFFIVVNNVNKTKRFFANGIFIPKETTNDNGEIIHNYDINCEAINNIEDNCNNILGNDLLIRKPIYDFYNNSVNTLKKNEKYSSLQEAEIYNKYKELLNKGKTIKFEDIQVNKYFIIVGEQFRMDFTPGFLDVQNSIKTLRTNINRENVRYNYNLIYENILSLSQINFSDFTPIQRRMSRRNRIRNVRNIKLSKDFTGTGFRINNMAISIYRKKQRMYINGIPLRINDIFPVLTRIICYNSLTEYEKYLKDVSKIGVEWIKLINTGINLRIQNPLFNLFEHIKLKSFTTKEIQLRFSLLWDKVLRTKVYLVINNTKYEIKYKQKFMKYFFAPDQYISICNLKKYLIEAIPELENVDIYKLVDDAVKEGKIVQERGKKLVEETLKEINAEECEITTGGTTYKGYKFKGLVTGTLFFIDKRELKVFKFTGGNWNMRCVVDDHTKQRIFEDRLANRLINIYNEPQYISTIH